MFDYFFGPDVGLLQRGLAMIMVGLLVCACGVCAIGSAGGVTQVAQEEWATYQAQPTVTPTPTITPRAAATLVPTFTPTPTSQAE